MLLGSSSLFVAFVQFVVQALVPAGGRAAPIGVNCGPKTRRGEQLPGFTVSAVTIVDQTAKAAKIEDWIRESSCLSWRSWRAWRTWRFNL
jgi:hypothetical protein